MRRELKWVRSLHPYMDEPDAPRCRTYEHAQLRSLLQDSEGEVWGGGRTRAQSGGIVAGLWQVRVSFREPHWSDPEKASHAKPHDRHEAADFNGYETESSA